MSDMEERTFSLHASDAALIDQLVALGAYATAGEIISASLRALQERDASVERWLRKEAIDRIRADHAARVKDDK